MSYERSMELFKFYNEFMDRPENYKRLHEEEVTAKNNPEKLVEKEFIKEKIKMKMQYAIK